MKWPAVVASGMLVVAGLTPRVAMAGSTFGSLVDECRAVLASTPPHRRHYLQADLMRFDLTMRFPTSYRERKIARENLLHTCAAVRRNNTVLLSRARER